MSRNVLLGAVIGAHGLKGEVKVKTFTHSPETFGGYGPLHTEDGRRFTVTHARSNKPGEAIVRFAEIAGRDAAESLKGTELFVSRNALPAVKDEEFYHADLIGLRAEDEEGRMLGTVAALHNFGASDVIEIARDNGDSVLLPFTREVVPVIEIEAGRVIISAPEEVEAETKGTVE
ncbi:MAG TPA: ribosome maturation factor RimM [Rhizomicrobium sp.]|nr:ribosome maturation factor RimM [Rhizomicrobium sp.]